MSDFESKSQEKETQILKPNTAPQQLVGEFAPDFIDNRSEAVDFNNLQQFADKSPVVSQLKSLEQKANKSLEQPSETSSKSFSGANKVLQRKKENNTSIEPSAESIIESDRSNIQAEQAIDPNSKDHKDKLNDLKSKDVDMGEGSRIELQGELTRSARFNKFLGNESTYSKLLRKAEDFNKSKDVVEKQALLKELKPLARTWLDKHAEAEASGKEDNNEQLKRASVFRFLNQTTSNYPAIISSYDEIKKTIASFSSDPVGNRAMFYKAVDDYETLQNLVKSYKSTYPPSINLLFTAELGEIEKADQTLLKSGTLDGTDFDTKVGLIVKAPKINFNLASGSYTFSGGLGFSLPNLFEAKGIVSIDFNKDDSIQNIQVTEGKCKARIGGFDIDLNGISYDFGSNSFSVDEAIGNLKIFENEIALAVEGFSMDAKGFDFEKIQGKLQKFDYGFFSLEETEISFTKSTGAFEGSTSYQFNVSESPFGFSDFATSGDVEIFWAPEGEKYYSIENGGLNFKLFKQEAEAENFSYDSRTQNLNVEQLNLDLALNDFKKTFKGNGITINKGGIDFEKLSTDASGKSFDAKIFTLIPEEYSITKEDDTLKAIAQGAVELNLPDFLGITTSGEIKGAIGFSVKDPIPEYTIDSASAEVKMPNPLNKISEILGDSWTSSRYELSAAIPVFPAISAIFGIYIKYALNFKDLLATINFDKEKNSVVFEANTSFKTDVEGGVFGGIQGGSPLLIALAILLRGAGIFDLITTVGYEKEFKLGNEPSEGKIKDDSGFKYSISGAVKIGAYLDVVATALHFFRKQFTLTLGEKSLGAFEYSNAKKADPTMGEEALASREDLENQIDPSLRSEARSKSLEDLLTLDYTHRFKNAEKGAAVDLFKSSESSRGENPQLGNLQAFDQFIDKRCNWTGIYGILDSLDVQAADKVNRLSDADKQNYLNNTLLSNIERLGEYSNIAQGFIDYYKEKIASFSGTYPETLVKSYVELLNKKSEVLQAVEDFKKDHLHSQLWGDKSKQKSNLKTTAFFGESKYQKFTTDYNVFKGIMIENRNVFNEVQKEGASTVFKIVQFEQRAKEGAKR